MEASGKKLSVQGKLQQQMPRGRESVALWSYTEGQPVGLEQSEGDGVGREVGQKSSQDSEDRRSVGHGKKFGFYS